LASPYGALSSFSPWSTDAVIDDGSGNGRSNLAMRGRMIRKCAN
jgi:hypothetical protein